MTIVAKLFQYLATWSLVPRLLLFSSLLAVLIWSAAMLTVWRFDSQHVRFFYDSHMQLFAKSLSELDLEKMQEYEDEVDDVGEIMPKKRKKRLEAVNETFSFAVFTQQGKRILSDDDGKDFPFLVQRGYSGIDIDDDRWRVYVYPAQGGKYYILVGQEAEYRHEVVYNVIMRHAWPWLMLLPIFLGGLAWILRRELKPLRTLAYSLSLRQAEDTRPLELAHVTPETRPLVQALNTLFERIAFLLVQERAFVANAAHELRTPLAGLRVQAEVLEMCIDDAVARENGVQKILEGTTRCTRLVEQLLLLSSLEAKSGTGTQENIPWHILVQDAQDTVYEVAQSKNIMLDVQVEAEPSLVHGHAELWGIALRNLLDNAVRYGLAGGRVQITLKAACIVVENMAKHVPQEALSLLGQRFYRLPGQKEKGSGLGLAIVGHIVTLHKAKVFVENGLLQGQDSVRVTIYFCPQDAQASVISPSVI